MSTPTPETDEHESNLMGCCQPETHLSSMADFARKLERQQDALAQWIIQNPPKQAISAMSDSAMSDKPTATNWRASLANDIARCDGVNEEGYWREGCETCLRRTAPRPEFFSMIAPPAIIAFECENLIEPIKEPKP